MPLLDRQGAKEDAWRRIEAIDDLSGESLIAPFALLGDVLAARRVGQKVGVFIENTVKAEALAPLLDQIDLVAIAFPASNNGRGFSIARQLRERGFRGIVRAVGPLISDQFPHALACGIDEIELPQASADRQPTEHWIAAAKRMSVAYQRGYSYGMVTSILEQRRAARRAGANNG
jgi:uncharacterized protein (DUF934 family)